MSRGNRRCKHPLQLFEETIHLHLNPENVLINYNAMKRLLFFILLISTLSFSSAQTESVTDLKEKIIDLQNEGTLGFRNLTVCNNILGFGQYVPNRGNQVKPGSTLLVYYEPENVFTNRLHGTYQIYYTQDMILTDSEGSILYEGLELLNFNYQTTSPVLDVYATNSLNLGDLPAGTYQLKLVLHDQLKQENAEQTVTFEIRP